MKTSYSSWCTALSSTGAGPRRRDGSICIPMIAMYEYYPRGSIVVLLLVLAPKATKPFIRFCGDYTRVNKMLTVHHGKRYCYYLNIRHVSMTYSQHFIHSGIVTAKSPGRFDYFTQSINNSSSSSSSSSCAIKPSHRARCLPPSLLLPPLATTLLN